MRRRLFTIVSAVSLLLCLATLAMWVRSYWRVDRFRTTRTSSAQAWLYSANGAIVFVRFDGPTGSFLPNSALTVLPRSEWRCLGLGASRESMALVNGSQVWDLSEFHIKWAFLFWISLGAAILFGHLVIHAIRRWRDATHGKCQGCGYDLRATPERCPECGTYR